MAAKEIVITTKAEEPAITAAKRAAITAAKRVVTSVEPQARVVTTKEPNQARAEEPAIMAAKRAAFTTPVEPQARVCRQVVLSEKD